MNLADGKIVIDTAIDTSGIDKGVGDIDKKIKKVNSLNIDGLKKSFGDTAKESKILGMDLGTLGQAFSKGGLSAAALAGVTASLTSAFVDLAMKGIQMAVQALSEFVQMSIQTSSDIQESMNVLDVVFDTTRVTEWAQSTAASFNMSAGEAMKYAGVIGGLLSPINLSNDSMEEMSIVLTQLAGDLSSLNNIPVDQAFTALRSALAGETEPMKNFGVNMSVANLQAYALSTGVNKVWTELSQAEQTLIRYNYLLENTLTAQGDAARSAGSYETSLKQVELAVSDAGATFGESLLPSLSSINNVIADFVSFNKPMIDFFGTLVGTLGNLVASATKFINIALKPMGIALNALAPLFTMMLDGINLVLNGWVEFWDETALASKDGTKAMEYDLQGLNQIVEDVNIDSYTSFKDMYEKVESLSGEHYDKLKGMAKDYNNAYTAQNDALDDYVNDSLRETMKKYEESYDGRNKTAQDYMKLARIEARERAELEDEVDKEKKKLDDLYLNRLKDEMTKQQAILKQQNDMKKKDYEDDVANFTKAEKEKTRIFNEEAKKRVGGGSDNSSSGSSGFSFGGFGGFNSNNSGMASRALTAYNGGDTATSSVSSSSTFNFNVSGMNVEQLLAYARQKERLR